VEPAPSHNFTAARRGLTFIESICAIAMLALVAAAVFGAFNSILAAQSRQAHRLGAMELANRLILQYLDDSDTMPNSALPILYGDEKYRWELHEIPVQLVPARPDIAEDRANSGSSAVSVNRMMAINVTVWLSEESGGTAAFDAAYPSATLTRLMDPIALRNPDTTKYLSNSAIKQRELIERFRAVGRNTSVKPASGASGAPKPAPSKPATGPSPSKGKPVRTVPHQGAPLPVDVFNPGGVNGGKPKGAS
jgi:prepilin-type N-terminal cleavage/methylation domain-containing protein